jgi:hypothetical protein
MSLGDVTIISPGGQNLPPALSYRVEAAATTINAGEPVKVSGDYALPSADAEPTTALTTFVGIASSTSTQTASLDGVVDVILAVPGIVYSCKATDPTLIDTDAELLALLNNSLVFNLSAGVYTVDTAVAAPTNGLRVVGGDITNGTISFCVRSAVTFYD